ncbi:nitroreductase/quinone reductase family protein [Amycolatopsis sp. CA-230715]|uniref:nitroreductase/quinone reductase family protein n=1 Tax=Amycolatopsis sp. CA-230715 TaxID=2745196 RepID=UPI001C019082|nr:nitroreductase/quinone reductase family protein [Amycolatopsis sp. CA-230715]QWF85179.1 hypothetical protein HUW46_08633 [Amycolatopsis sp. CA-230715]
MPEETGAARRRKVRRLQRYLINPPLVLALRLGVLPGHALLETTGRRTGRRRRTIVGVRLEGKVLWLVAEQGSHAGYVRNLMANPEIKVFHERRWYRATAALDPDTDPEALLDAWPDARHARNVRRFGTDLKVIRVEVAEPAT